MLVTFIDEYDGEYMDDFHDITSIEAWSKRVDLQTGFYPMWGHSNEIREIGVGYKNGNMVIVTGQAKYE